MKNAYDFHRRWTFVNEVAEENHYVPFAHGEQN